MLALLISLFQTRGTFGSVCKVKGSTAKLGIRLLVSKVSYFDTVLLEPAVC